jgi:hypothetical protein
MLCLSPLSCILLCFFIRPSFRAADALAMATARIASLEAELEASRKAWDTSTAAKATAEKLAKAATAKAKKAKKVLADANQGRLQREKAIADRLNRISALAGGNCLSAFSLSVCLSCWWFTCYLFVSACREDWGILGAATAD